MGEERKGDWVQTFTGKMFWPLDPRPEEVDVEDIAHALSLMCRFGGHCDEFYSVAQHSVFVSENVPPESKLAALLHDASEAYLADVTRPVKKSLPDYFKIEDNLTRVIYEHAGVKNYDAEAIVRADMIMLYTEMRDLMKTPPKAWEEQDKYSDLMLDEIIIPLSSQSAEELFLVVYQELTGRKV